MPFEIPLATPVNNLLGPSTEAIGQTLGNFVKASLADINFQLAFSAKKFEYAERLLTEDFPPLFEQIPENQRVLPRRQIAVPILEHVDAVYEEETLRCMFATLLTSECTLEKQDIVHPGFARIITELLPIEAEMLLKMKHVPNGCFLQTQKRSEISNIAKVVKVSIFWDDAKSEIFTENFLEKVSLVHYENLERLSLIKISSPFDSAHSHLLSSYPSMYEDQLVKLIAEITTQPPCPLNEKERLEFYKGKITLSQFGVAFLNAVT